MTIPELIANVLGAIYRQLYADRPHDFFRDKKALTGAITRYGYECHQRGWEFDVRFLLQELMKAVGACKKAKVNGWLPLYLEGVIDQHIREHAEELSAENKSMNGLTRRALSKVPRPVERDGAGLTPTEALALLYRDIKRQSKAPKATKLRQKELF